MFCFAKFFFPVISIYNFLLLSFYCSSLFDRIFKKHKTTTKNNTSKTLNNLYSSSSLEQHCPPVFSYYPTAFTYLLSLWMLLMDSCIFNTSASKEAITYKKKKYLFVILSAITFHFLCKFCYKRAQHIWDLVWFTVLPVNCFIELIAINWCIKVFLMAIRTDWNIYSRVQILCSAANSKCMRICFVFD